MWSAIKSDLFDFVTTIQEDTTKTLNKVLGETEEGEDEADSTLEKLAVDVRRSFETYGTVIGEANNREYQKFKKSFNLGAFANDIRFVLDEEPEVSRFYAELVPIELSPEEFWSRCFFRLNMVYRKGNADGVLGDEEDDEEELVWDAGEDEKNDTVSTNAESDKLNTSAVIASSTFSASASSDQLPSTRVADSAELIEARRRIAEVEEDNARMKGQIRTLVSRVSELEQLLLEARTLNEDLVSQQHLTNTSTKEMAEKLSAMKTAHSPRSDSSSVSSVDSAASSGVLLSHADGVSMEGDESRHGETKPNVESSGSVNKPPQTSSDNSCSKTTTTYLAAVDDDDDDEENGWN